MNNPYQQIRSMQAMIGRWKIRPVMDYRQESGASVLSRMRAIRLLLVRADEILAIEEAADIDDRTRRTARTYAEAAYSIACEHIPTMPRGGMYAATAADIIRRIEKTPLLTIELKKRASATPKPRKAVTKPVSPDPCKMCRHRDGDYCEAACALCRDALHTHGCDAPSEILPPREKKI